MIAVDQHSPEHALATGSADKSVRVWTHEGSGRLRLARTFPVGSTVRRLIYLIDSGIPMRSSLVRATWMAGSSSTCC
jgi:hypothetical protein